MGSRSDSGSADGFAATVLRGLEATMLAGEEGAEPSLAQGAPGAEHERYERGATLGEGGMGRVLEATDRLFGRRVALKELLVEAASAPLLRRFLLEALVTANLEHPGIVAVYERGVREGRPFYVMRKLEGRTLSAALKEASSLAERLTLVSSLVRVAQTVAFAHDRGVIHRDLKPENVILGTHGEVTVIDWGIARVRSLGSLGLGDSPLVGDGALGKTLAGSVLGTPAYMAPEQAAGRLEEVDERTDVFALGALLYHLLAGRPPYDGPTVEALLVSASQGTRPAVTALEPEAPARLVELCERAMAKEPSQRFRSAGELAEALERALTEGLTARGSQAVPLLATVVTAGMFLFSLAGMVLVWRSIPSLAELGGGVRMMITVAALAGLFLVLELATRGRHRLMPLAQAFTVLTLLGGLLSTAMGVLNTFRAANRPEVLRDEAAWRELLTMGLFESLGNTTTGLATTGLLVLFWAVVQRKLDALRSRSLAA